MLKPQPTIQRPAKKPKSQNPIEQAVTSWLSSLRLPPQSTQADIQELSTDAPKRWTLYEPMVLLPTGSFASLQWSTFFSGLEDGQAQRLWSSILAEISKKSGSKTALTHLAVNEGIPLHSATPQDAQSGELPGQADENILRSPSGLRMLYGDFGPTEPSGPGGGVTEQDFLGAFWVSTRQNGIFQSWAPRWTMFSRGNIKEKARLLDFHSPNSGDLQHRRMSADQLRGRHAVDLYAGIGYFVFSYAKLGLRVLCWELNPWSVEGLRRGAVGNGWSVKVVQGHELELPMGELVSGGEQIIVFLEDNQNAARRIRDLRESMSAGDGAGEGELDIKHVNGGLLPTSENSWKDAWNMAAETENDSREAWLHLHENVGVADIEGRRVQIQDFCNSLPHHGPLARRATVEHVELVKTFAPGVWHCVFDVYITGSSSIT